MKISRPHGVEWVGAGVIALITVVAVTGGALALVDSARAANDVAPSPSPSTEVASPSASPSGALAPVTDLALLPIGPPVDEELLALIEAAIAPFQIPGTTPPTDPGTAPGGSTTPGGGTSTGGSTPGGGTPPGGGTTTPPPPPPPAWEPWSTTTYYEGSSSDFCAKMDAARQGVGAGPFASCTRSESLTNHAKAMAEAYSIWHSGADNIVGGPASSMQSLVNAFMGSSGHYAQIVGTSMGEPVLVDPAEGYVGCYWIERHGEDVQGVPWALTKVFCAGAFTHHQQY